MKKPKVLMVFMPRTILRKINKTMGNELLVVEGLNRGASLPKDGLLPKPPAAKVVKTKTKTKTITFSDLSKSITVTVPSGFERVKTGIVQKGDLLYDRVKAKMEAPGPFELEQAVVNKICVVRKTPRGKA